MAEGTAKKKRTGAMKRAVEAPLAERIVDVALDLAEESGWDAVRLRHVATRLSVPLTDVLAQYRDFDAVANACIW